MKNKLQKGFTLIELLVVIAIIGILVGLSVFGLNGARQASRDAVRKADLEQIRSGLGIYNADCNKYPLTANFVLTTSRSLVGSTPPTSCAVANTYISATPVDPVSTRRYYYVSAGTTYSICAALEQAPSPALNVTACGAVSNCGSSCNYIVSNP